MRKIFFIWSGLFVAFVSSNALAQSVCSPLIKTTKYTLQKGEYPAAVLRKFGLEPVFGKKGTMNQMLKLNNFKNTNAIEPGTAVVLPFNCEEQVANFRIIDDEKDFRFVTTEKVSSTSPPVQEEVQAPIPPVVPEVADDKKDEKLSKMVTTPAEEADQQALDVEAASKKSQDNISEALRYRMICEGEWTGSECITRYTALFVDFGGYNNRYDGVDTNAAPGTQRDGLLLSKLNLAVGFGWDNYWNENIKTTLYAEIQKNEMLPDIKDIPIEGGDRLLTSLQGEVRYEKGSWGIGLGYRQFDKLYYIFNFQDLVNGFCSSADLSLCGVRVYTANVSSLFGDISYLIHQSGKFRVDTEFKYFTIAATQVSTVNVSAGHGESFEFSVTHDRIEEYLKGTLKYAMASQDTSIERQTAKELSLMFTYSWKLKDWNEATTEQKN